MLEKRKKFKGLFSSIESLHHESDIRPTEEIREKFIEVWIHRTILHPKRVILICVVHTFELLTTVHQFLETQSHTQQSRK